MEKAIQIEHVLPGGQWLVSLVLALPTDATSG